MKSVRLFHSGWLRDSTNTGISVDFFLAVDSFLKRRRTVLPFLKCLSYHTEVFIRLRVFLPISILSFMVSLKAQMAESDM